MLPFPIHLFYVPNFHAPTEKNIQVANSLIEAIHNLSKRSNKDSCLYVWTTNNGYNPLFNNAQVKSTFSKLTNNNIIILDIYDPKASNASYLLDSLSKKNGINYKLLNPAVQKDNAITYILEMHGGLCVDIDVANRLTEIMPPDKTIDLKSIQQSLDLNSVCIYDEYPGFVAALPSFGTKGATEKFMSNAISNYTSSIYAQRENKIFSHDDLSSFTMLYLHENPDLIPIILEEETKEITFSTEFKSLLQNVNRQLPNNSQKTTLYKMIESEIVLTISGNLFQDTCKCNSTRCESYEQDNIKINNRRSKVEEIGRKGFGIPNLFSQIYKMHEEQDRINAGKTYSMY